MNIHTSQIMASLTNPEVGMNQRVPVKTMHRTQAEIKHWCTWAAVKWGTMGTYHFYMH